MMYRREDYLTAIELVEAKKVSLMPLVSKTYPFQRFADAYQFIDENRDSTLKVIINIQE